MKLEYISESGEWYVTGSPWSILCANTNKVYGEILRKNKIISGTKVYYDIKSPFSPMLFVNKLNNV